MKIDYTKIDSRIRQTIQNIEAKPHAKYIRYLLAKKYSPVYIKKELYKAGLSAPHEDQLVKYYLAVIDPAVKVFGLEKIYNEYKRKMTMRNAKRAPGAYMKDLLNYKTVFGEEMDLQPNFHKFIKFLGIDELWIKEIMSYHGTAENLPSDENGERILKCKNLKVNYEKVLYCEKRYVVDKLLLENLPDSRIADFLKENYKITNITNIDVGAYRSVFFNMRSVSIEETINTLEIERESLKQLLIDIDRGKAFNDMSVADKALIKRQNEERVEELSSNIRELTAQHTDVAYAAANMNAVSYESIFADIMLRGYDRFRKLDSDNRMDVVDPMMKMANIITKAHDKITSIKENPVWQKGTDKHSDEVLLELYKQKCDDIYSQEIEKANKRIAATGSEFLLSEELFPEDIEGLDELGVNIIEDDVKKDDNNNEEEQ